MFWLVLYYTSVVVIPEKYGTIEQCRAAGQEWVQRSQFACIPANKTDKPSTCEAFAPGSNMIICK